jgi:trehalose 6-phosphate phosphatase
VTDLDGFTALIELADEGKLDHAVRVGVRSDEGPREILEQADLVVEGIEGFQQVLAKLDAA